MKKITAYKSDRGKVFENKEDALHDDNILKEGLDFEAKVLNANFPDSYYTNIGNWDCEESPVGKCVYDFNNPMGDDDCMFCHGPDERK